MAWLVYNLKLCARERKRLERVFFELSVHLLLKIIDHNNVLCFKIWDMYEVLPMDAYDGMNQFRARIFK